MVRVLSIVRGELSESELKVSAGGTAIRIEFGVGWAIVVVPGVEKFNCCGGWEDEVAIPIIAPTK